MECAEKQEASGVGYVTHIMRDMVKFTETTNKVEFWLRYRLKVDTNATRAREFRICKSLMTS